MLTWQPIETAPKDGTKYLAADKDGRLEIENAPSNCAAGYWDFDKKTQRWGGHAHQNRFKAAYWMPLPPAPKDPMLTKEQDKQATRLRDAGVPGDIAVFLASRLDESFPKSKIGAKAKNAAWAWFWWSDQPEGDDWWWSFDVAYAQECIAKGIK